MANRKSKISWTERNLPYTTGCTQCSEGCKNCWAMKLSERQKRLGLKLWENGFEFTLHPEILSEPSSVKEPSTFFVCPSSDLFHPMMKFEDINKLMEMIRRNPKHTFQILTKRADRMVEYFSSRRCPFNVWLGVTVENANHKDRIESLAEIDCPNRWVSFEPLIGPIEEVPCADKIRWWVVGGENTSNFPRPMKEEWVLDLKRQADSVGAAFFFKQWGSVGCDGVRRSVKANGHRLQGNEYLNIPELILPQPKIELHQEKGHMKCKKNVEVLIGIEDLDAAVSFFEQRYYEMGENEADIPIVYHDMLDDECRISFSSIPIPEDLTEAERDEYLNGHIDQGIDCFALCCNPEEDIIVEDGVKYYVFTPKLIGDSNPDDIQFWNEWLEEIIPTN